MKHYLPVMKAPMMTATVTKVRGCSQYLHDPWVAMMTGRFIQQFPDNPVLTDSLVHSLWHLAKGYL